MTTFEKALPIILKNEGGYVNDPNDKGGETYRGISRKNNPRWTGWAIVDSHKPLKKGQIIQDAALDNAVAALYKVNYWQKMWGENIKHEKVAIFLLDWFITSGYHAVEALQRLVDCKPDGLMGTSTVRAVNNTPEQELFPRFKQSRIDFYKKIARLNPTQEKYLQGWLNRVNQF